MNRGKFPHASGVEVHVGGWGAFSHKPVDVVMKERLDSEMLELLPAH